jgi:hypothetical protein
MSTIPLSLREGYGQTLSGDDAPTAPSTDDGKLDALIENVSEKVANRDRAAPADEPLLDVSESDDADSWRALKAKLDDPAHGREQGGDSALDRALKQAVDRRAHQEAESADFHQSRTWRDALTERYDRRVAIGDLLDTFADWHACLKTDPKAAADAIASAYLEQSPYALPAAARTTGKPGVPADVAASALEAPGQKLNRILEAAIDRHHGKRNDEPEALVGSARHRAALKEMFPGMTYAEACRRVVTLDGDLHRDPLGTAARLAASYGLPLTTSQQAATEQRQRGVSDAQRIVAEGAQRMPDLAALQEEVVAVLSRPDFVHGPDMQQNLVRAHRIAHLVRQEQQRRRAQTNANPSPSPTGLDGLIGQAMAGAA